ncbi:MAG: hypothetical protein QGH94_14645 [Phycisphaerae bacterium]|jgi:hypothetical protein|nr:hypothetical protein [Phycisphaerae bacterium]MDP7289222.1 hypothetical protein [Phycisphaerae bacterium]
MIRVAQRTASDTIAANALRWSPGQTPSELRRITLWLDCNSDFYGTYEKLPDQAAGKIIKPILK